MLILSASYTPVLGGLQTAAHALARQFRVWGHEVRVVTSRYPRSLPAHETIDGVPVERWPFITPRWGDLGRGRPDLFAAGLYCYPAVLGRLCRFVREFQPNVVNVHFPDAQIPFVLPQCRQRRFRLVASLHGDEVMRFTGGEGGKLVPGSESRGLRALLREADAVTACSPDLRAAAARLEPSVAAKCSAIYNGIDPGRYTDKTPYAHRRPYVLAYGRFTHKKGFDLLLEAFARLNPEGAHADLILAGGGEERPSLEALAGRLGLADRVFFLGRVAPPEVVRLLNGCLFLAVPSRAEPFGIVALEGLAAGKPVVATRVGGMGPFLADLRAKHPDLPVRLSEPTVAGLALSLSEQLAADPVTDAAPGAILRDEYSWAQAARRYEHILEGSAVSEQG